MQLRHLLVLALVSLSACTDASTPDLCPDDPAKEEQGACGCGVADTDANDNGVPDCFDARIDLCPDDLAKTQAGTCGCGVSDDDTTGDGIPDCLDASVDLCPDDPAKTQAGTCGCGISDADQTGNGVPDCLDANIDLCPGDPGKTTPGACGCGTTDDDLNHSGVPDCLDAGIDLCPNNPSKVQPGTCGCGLSDGDFNGNLIPDCYDQAIEIAYVSEIDVNPGSATTMTIGNIATIINTSLGFVSVNDPQIRDIRYYYPLIEVVPSVSGSTGALRVATRTDQLSPQATTLLTTSQLIGEPVGSGQFVLSLDLANLQPGAQFVELTLTVDQRQLLLRILVRVVETGPALVFVKAVRQRSTAVVFD